MERADRAPVGTFHAPGAWGASVALSEAAAHHAQVKRLAVGDVVRLTSGDGRRVTGVLAELGKGRARVELQGADVETVPAPLPVVLLAPIGDRDRMLWLAEKAVELGVSEWRPVSYRRSRSVSPRGEGEAFAAKVRLRMIAALEQSGGAWLPALHPDATPDEARAAVAPLAGVLLDAGGPPLAGVLLDGGGAPLADMLLDAAGPSIGERASVGTPGFAIALGPEGGLDPDERDAFLAAGWRAASLGANVLRFETAGIAALAVLRAIHRATS